MLGTNPYPFTRLLDKVIEWSEKTDEHVIVQSGNTPVLTDKIEFYPFIDHVKILRLMSEADVVITQGGFGSLQDCIQMGVKIIAVPRLPEMGESMDDQREIVNALAEENLVVPLYDVANLSEAIETAKNAEIEAIKTYSLPEHIATTINEILGK